MPIGLFAVDYRAIGITVAVIVLVAFVALLVRNILQARAELGSEIELAPNKKEYLTDEELEGPKLDKALSFALILLGISALSIPFYWLAEPGRQEGAVDAYQLNFESRGRDLYTEGAQCVNCHAANGVGGVAAYVLQDADGQFIANASWQAPALNNLFNRYDEAEVTYILNFGRPGSPMAAWGTPGGGPLTPQQVQNIIEYIQTFQVQSLDPIVIDQADDPAVALSEAAAVAVSIRDELQRSIDDGEFATLGEAVFNLGYFSGFQAGASSCGRCHTAGWSLGPTGNPPPGPSPLDEGVAGCGGGNPSGIGFSLCGTVTERFPDDSWKLPDGSWAPEGGLADGDGFFYLSLAGDEIRLDDKGTPITGRVDDAGEPVPYEILPDGNLADCGTISGLWEPEGIVADAYPFDPTIVLVSDDSADGFENPPELSPDDLPAEVIMFEDGRVGGGCTIVEMPERTSYAHYNFIFNGAEAGQGYGRGGQSAAGMMPSFGGLLPPEYIQAVVDYERSLG